MEKEKLEKLLSYIFSSSLKTERRFVFVDDFQVFLHPSFTEWSRASEECGFKVENEEFIRQGTYLRLATNTVAQLRHYEEEQDKWVVDQKFDFSEIFGEQEVVIATSNESLLYYAPVCKSKLELAEFIILFRKYIGKDYMDSYHAREAIDLAKFLYKHNPDKVSDELDDL